LGGLSGFGGSGGIQASEHTFLRQSVRTFPQVIHRLISGSGCSMLVIVAKILDWRCAGKGPSGVLPMLRPTCGGIPSQECLSEAIIAEVY
jgi:hypothetical protein